MVKNMLYFCVCFMGNTQTAAHPKRKWYYLTNIIFSIDSVFVTQSPVSISKKKTLYIQPLRQRNQYKHH